MTRQCAGFAAVLAGAVGWSALTGVLLAAASVVPYGGLGLIALAPLLGRAATVPPHGHGALARPLAAMLGAPALLAMPLLMGGDAVVRSHWACGTGQMAAFVVFPVLAFFLGMVSGAASLGAAVVAPRLLGRVAPILRGGALLATAALIVAGAFRGARTPAPESWALSLPIAARGELDAAAGDCSLAPLPFTVPEAHRTVVARCAGTTARLEIADVVGGPLGVERDLLGQLEIASQVPFEVRTHAGLGLAVVVQGGRAVAAFDASSGRLVDVSLRMVAHEVAPPWPALLAATLGVAVAMRRARRARSERVASARLAEAETAMVGDDGVVAPDGGGAAFRPPGATLPAGPALILARPVRGPFRSGPDRGTWVVCGDLASNLEAHRARAAAFDLEAAAAIAVAAAPLVAAAMRGLVL